jgi:hypothetical protein
VYLDHQDCEGTHKPNVILLNESKYNSPTHTHTHTHTHIHTHITVSKTDNVNNITEFYHCQHPGCDTVL